MTYKEIAEKLKAAFYEGYDSYATQCVSFTDEDTEWENSEAKKTYDYLLTLEK